MLTCSVQIESEKAIQEAQRRKDEKQARERLINNARQPERDDRRGGRDGFRGGRGGRGRFNDRENSRRGGYGDRSASPLRRPPYQPGRYQSDTREVDRYEPSDRRDFNRRPDPYRRPPDSRGGLRDPVQRRRRSPSVSSSRSRSRSQSTSARRSRSRSRSRSRLRSPSRRRQYSGRSSGGRVRPSRRNNRRRSTSSSYESSRSRSRRRERSRTPRRQSPRRYNPVRRSEQRERPATDHHNRRSPSMSPAEAPTSNDHTQRAGARRNQNEPPLSHPKPHADDVKVARKRSRSRSEDPNRSPTPPLRKGRGFQQNPHEARGILSRDRPFTPDHGESGYKISSLNRVEEQRTKRPRRGSRLSPVGVESMSLDREPPQAGGAGNDTGNRGEVRTPLLETR